MLLVDIPMILFVDIMHACVNQPPCNHFIILEQNVLMTSSKEIAHLGEIALEQLGRSPITKSSLSYGSICLQNILSIILTLQDKVTL